MTITTLKEYIAVTHPGMVNDRYEGGVLGCPMRSLFPDNVDLPSDSDCVFVPKDCGGPENCTHCWNRLLPEPIEIEDPSTDNSLEARFYAATHIKLETFIDTLETDKHMRDNVIEAYRLSGI